MCTVVSSAGCSITERDLNNGEEQKWRGETVTVLLRCWEVTACASTLCFHAG